jgi:hypothetical protein
MEVRIEKKLATEKENGQRSAAKKIDCGRMLINIRQTDR